MNTMNGTFEALVDAIYRQLAASSGGFGFGSIKQQKALDESGFVGATEQDFERAFVEGLIKKDGVTANGRHGRKTIYFYKVINYGGVKVERRWDVTEHERTQMANAMIEFVQQSAGTPVSSDDARFHAEKKLGYAFVITKDWGVLSKKVLSKHTGIEWYDRGKYIYNGNSKKTAAKKPKVVKSGNAKSTAKEKVSRVVITGITKLAALVGYKLRISSGGVQVEDTEATVELIKTAGRNKKDN